MNENHLLYRLFLNFCITTTVGLLAVALEYLYAGETAISLQTIGYILCSGAVVGIVFEGLFVNVFPLSGNHLKRSVLWRNRMIAAIVNAVVVTLLGELMIGVTTSLVVLLAIAIALCIIAVVAVSLIADIRYRRSVAEMNRRLKQLNDTTHSYSITSSHESSEGD